MPAPPPDPAPAPAWRARLGRLDPLGALVRLLLLGLVGAAGGILLVPPGPGWLPGPGAPGRPALETVKADRDYAVVDEEATARHRAAAGAAERPVYDQDEGAGEEAVARIHAAFEVMRGEEAALRSQRGAAGPAELARRYESQRDAFVSRLQLVPREEDLAALGAARFAEPVERELAALAAKGLSGLVVGDRALLPEDLQAGLVVRSFRGGEPVGTAVVTDGAAVRDVATARDEVARAAAARLAGQPAALRAALTHLATAALRPTMVHNRAETERRRAEAAARVRPVVIPVRRGERIVAAGELVEPRHLVISEAMRAAVRGEGRAMARLAGAGLLALLAVVAWAFARRAFPAFRPGRRGAALLALLLAGAMAATAGGLALADLAADRWPGLPRSAIPWLVPLAAVALVAREVLSAEAAMLAALAAGLGAGLVAGPSIAPALQGAVTGLAAAALAGRPRRGPRLLLPGLAAGLSGAALAAALEVLAGRGRGEVLAAAGAALVGGVAVVPAAAAALLVLADRVLGAVTEGRLRRLANLNHPALKELIVQAPGTYHHSIVMGTLAEGAARAIGADPLLARVAAYYHDIGKTRSPLAFAENQRGYNEHDGLPPSMSALVVKRHVADGLELARRWRLPRAVADAIPQHHGTRLVGYFWAKQRKAAEAGGPAAAEALFRYPGPRPDSRERALVMIADVCEASARALPAPTPAQLRALVDERLAELVEERQLDDCALTLRDLAAVAEAMAAGLAEVHGARPAGERREGAPRSPVHLVARS